MKKQILALFAGAMMLAACNTTPSQPSTVKSFDEIVSGRFSCKKFDSQQISKEHLDAILEAGRLAPTARNDQEQRVYVCQSEEVLAKIDKQTPCRYNAPTCLVVAYDRSKCFVYPGEKYNSGAEDATIVATHMILAAENVGVKSCWINFFNPDSLAAALALPDNEQVVMIMDLGYGAEDAQPLPSHSKRKPIEETVVYM